MTEHSEEGKLEGLGWVRGAAQKFKFGPDSSYKVPHMGWNFVKVEKKSAIIPNEGQDKRFYFVHSYYVKLSDTEDLLTSTDFGGEFCSSFERGNIVGVQFHPEKSHKFGMQLLKNFVDNY